MSDRQATGAEATIAQLKRDIDAGRTGDKVAFPDPGLSPLGTDDEAAGQSPRPEAVALARNQEKAAGAAAAAEVDGSKSERTWFIPVLVTILLLIVVGLGVYGLLR
jgi:hypothetical protein